ncbi:MAG TPA: cytochrome c [Pseudolabrys sp.]|jgi:mono/diheme cytochrome c family protein|nr:cytochrome c [Pseudolabrys sp.]
MTIKGIRCLLLAAIAVNMPMGEPAFAAASQQPDGQQVYVREGCQVCHGGMGRGGVGPSFVGDRLLALPDYVVTRILIGGGEMPAFEDKISDAEIAAVANYIRTTWGDQPGNITARQITAERKKLSKEASKEASKQPK